MGDPDHFGLRARPDNNSADRTAEIAEETAIRRSLEYRRVVEPEPGKHRALNTALATVTTPLVVSVDADTFLHRDALTYLIARITSRPQDQHTCASAGGVVVLNGPDNLLTRMQDWDYRLGINGVKRMQAAYNSALVAQGAFSAYWTDDLVAVGGWPDALGARRDPLPVRLVLDDAPSIHGGTSSGAGAFIPPTTGEVPSLTCSCTRC